MANINLDRRAKIDYTAVRGDSFIPPPISFEIDNEPEDFSGCELKMTIRKGNELKMTITNGDDAGIQVQENVLQYEISSDDFKILDAGIYKYDVQKKTADSIVTTIQTGIIQILNDETK